MDTAFPDRHHINLSVIINALTATRDKYYREYDLGTDAADTFIRSLDYVTPQFFDCVVKKISESEYKRVVCYAPRDLTHAEPFKDFSDCWRAYETTSAYHAYKEESEDIAGKSFPARAEPAWLSCILMDYLEANDDHILMYDLRDVPDPKKTIEEFPGFRAKSTTDTNHYYVCRSPIEVGELCSSLCRAHFIFLGIMSRIPPQPEGAHNWCDALEMSDYDYNYIVDNIHGCFSLIWDLTAYAVCWLDESWRVQKGKQGTSSKANT